jgi:hypothetical protein
MKRFVHQFLKWGFFVCGLFAALIVLNARFLTPISWWPVRISVFAMAAIVCRGAFDVFSRFN